MIRFLFKQFLMWLQHLALDCTDAEAKAAIGATGFFTGQIHSGVKCLFIVLQNSGVF